MMLATSPITTLSRTETKPAAGVIATRPTTAPIQAPIAEGFRPRIQSKKIQPSMAAAEAVFVVAKAMAVGPEDRFLNLFGEMAMLSPVLPLIGGGRTPLQPVFVGDVAAAVAAAVDGAVPGGRVYELGGPEVLTFRSGDVTVIANTGAGTVPLPAGRVILDSGDAGDGLLPGDTTVWVIGD